MDHAMGGVLMDDQERIHDMIHLLVPVLNQYDPNIGASAMIELLVCKSMDNGKSKETFLSEMSQAWDHYYDQYNNNNG